MADGWLETPFDLSGKSIYVAGHKGMVGSAICRRLKGENCSLLTSDFDLREQRAVQDWMGEHKPDVVILAAAKVGGIFANDTQPADFLYDNLMIEANIIRAAQDVGVSKLMFLGSSCIYPKDAAQPIRETALLTGALEPTNEAYAIAKIAGLKLCAAFRKQYGSDFVSVIPCNLYGQGDRFDEQSSHVIPALLMKAHAAKEAGLSEMSVWGSGAPMREFLYVDDLADACVFALKNYSDAPPLNIGSGEEVSIRALAEEICAVVGFDGALVFDASKPDGTMRKVMDSGRIQGAGWRGATTLADGLRKTYAWYCDQNRVINIKDVA